MKIEQIISDAAVKAVKALYGIEAAPGTTVPQKTKKEFEGNLTLVVFPFLKASHKAPEATAQEIGEYLLANEPAVASFNVIKGFLNLVIAPSFGARCCITSTRRPISGRIKLPPMLLWSWSNIPRPIPTNRYIWDMCATTCWDIVFPRF